MNKEIRILIKQSLFDISIEQCGSIDAVFDLAELNGLAITDFIAPGTVLIMPEPIDKAVADYYRIKGLKPATNISPTGEGGGEGGGGIEDLLDDGIDFMAVGVDNVVM